MSVPRSNPAQRRILEGEEATQELGQRWPDLTARLQ